MPHVIDVTASCAYLRGARSFMKERKPNLPPYNKDKLAGIRRHIIFVRWCAEGEGEQLTAPHSCSVRIQVACCLIGVRGSEGRDLDGWEVHVYFCEITDT